VTLQTGSGLSAKSQLCGDNLPDPLAWQREPSTRYLSKRSTKLDTGATIHEFDSTSADAAVTP
jgi:hypothetical protein